MSISVRAERLPDCGADFFEVDFVDVFLEELFGLAAELFEVSLPVCFFFDVTGVLVSFL